MVDRLRQSISALQEAEREHNRIQAHPDLNSLQHDMHATKQSLFFLHNSVARLISFCVEKLELEEKEIKKIENEINYLERVVHKK